MTQHRDPDSCSLSSLPKPLSPNFPQTSLVHSVPPLLKPRGRGYKWNCMHWPFKSLSVSSAVSPWQTEILPLFTAGCHLGSFPALVLQAGEPSLEFRPHTSQKEHPWPLKFPSSTPSSTRGSPASPFASPLHSAPVILWWSGFFCLSMVVRLLSSYCPVGYFRWFICDLFVIPYLFWEEISVASNYSSAILDPPLTLIILKAKTKIIQFKLQHT